MLKLKPRLKMAADMVRAGSRVADIGTDHAYLPTALILEGKIPSAIAADLRKGPLENAEATVRSYSIADKVQLRLSDGLKLVMPDEADDIVIAGMGGILITEILTAAPWVKDKAKRLILQPQSHSEDVRKYLFENGFEIIEENACFEDNKVYICMCAEFTGIKTEHSEAEILLGRFIERDDEASVAFKEKKLKRIRVRLEALIKTQPDCEEIAMLRKILDEVK
ncbi:MAG: class I SAM-dependent methyltransferase [Clostridia bacterium]|nr:class I SAM-dependent methyltransferase [Clostridia bacterium]